MTTECTAGAIEFHPLNGRQVSGEFNGGMITSDGGGLMLREVERRTGVVRRFAACFTDYRAAQAVEHSLGELVTQRVFALALGYEDLNDHDELRKDTALAVMVDKDDLSGQSRRRRQDRGAALAGKSTLNRLELGEPERARDDRYKKIVLDEAQAADLLVELFLDAHRVAPPEIVLDLDATDDPVHGRQEGRFFHGYYDAYCYLPLYIFCGDELLGAKLRTADQDAAAGAREELARVVALIRRRWPRTWIVVRADSGFCREDLLAWIEEQPRVDYVIGLARNERLTERVAGQQRRAARRFGETGQAARVFTEFRWRTRNSWSRSRRVVAKAEHLSGGPNPRFIVTSLGSRPWNARRLYEELYCARGEMENRIKEQQLALFADRTSCSRFRANQLRLFFSSMAYTLLQGLRRIGLRGTEMARAQCQTIRLKLLKVGALVRVTVRRVWISWSGAYPYQHLFRQVLRNLRC